MKNTPTQTVHAGLLGLLLLVSFTCPARAASQPEIEAFAARVVAEHATLANPIQLEDYLKAQGIEAGAVRTAILARSSLAQRAAQLGLRPGSEAWQKFLGAAAGVSSVAPVIDDNFVEAAARRLGFVKTTEAAEAAEAVKKKLEEKLTREVTELKAKATEVEAKALGAVNDSTKAVANAEKTTALANKSAEAANESAKISKDQLNKFDGLGFGTGLALTYDLGKRERVKKASLDPNRKIRVEEDTNITPRFIIETHKLFLTEKGEKKFKAKNLDDPRKETWQPDATGLFVSAEPGGDTINSIGGGFMLAWASAFDSERKVVRSFNLSLGCIVDQNVQVLGNGQKPDMVLPVGEEIRYRKTSQVGLILMFSAGF